MLFSLIYQKESSMATLRKKIKSLRKKIQWHLKMTVVEGGKVLETFSIHAVILTPQVMGQGCGH